MPDADSPQSDDPSPMIKEETVKDDGRTLIYYTFPDDADSLNGPATEDTDV